MFLLHLISMKKICCIFNYPPHYRKNIYQLMDRELSCDFYFGENVPGTLRKMDCSILKGFKSFFKNEIYKNKIIWQCNTLKLLFDKHYDTYILSVDTACVSEWIFLYFAKIIGKRTFLWTHGWYGNENIFTRIRKKTFYYPCTGLLLYSNYAKQLLIKQGLPKNKLYVIANSLDYDKQKEIQKSLQKETIYQERFGNNNPVILFIGRLEPKKKLSNILAAIKLLKEKSILINCIFIGEGSDKENLKNITQQLELTNSVWFYGACYDEIKIASLIYNSDICLSPGNVGLTSIHALTFGTPVITHNNFCNQMPEFEAIEEGSTGLFFKEGDINDMVQTIEQWLKQYPHKTPELIKNCYRIIDEKYNPHYQMEIIKQAIKIL